MGFTEFSYFASKSGAPFPDPDTPEGKDIKHMLETAAAQPGAGRIYWGHAVEKPHQQWLFLDWDSVEEHLAYRTTPEHDVVAKSMSSYLDWKDGYIKHVVTKPWPPTILAEAPVTEVLTLFFPAELDEDAKEELSKQLEEFKAKALDTSSDFKGIAYGWSKENDVPVTAAYSSQYGGNSENDKDEEESREIDSDRSVGVGGLEDEPSDPNIEAAEGPATRLNINVPSGKLPLTIRISFTEIAFTIASVGAADVVVFVLVVEWFAKVRL
ncbi:hypothetical protein K4K59_009420 [Colletotrichum sp. SAR11_240]|nr:hypothetical protein K4K59_009420 [Colletotrichum sp. SAR11_240]